MIEKSHLGPRGHEYDVEQPPRAKRTQIWQGIAIKGLEDMNMI